jgi:hypothetical protein
VPGSAVRSMTDATRSLSYSDASGDSTDSSVHTPLLSQEHTLECAALHVSGSLHDRRFSNFESMSQRQRRFHGIYHAAWWRRLYVTVSLLHIVQAAIEHPSMFSTWRRNGVLMAFVLEWVWLCFYAVDVWMAYMLGESSSIWSFAKRRWQSSRAVMIVVMLVDVLLTGATRLDEHRFRFSRGLRPFMLVRSGATASRCLLLLRALFRCMTLSTSVPVCVCACRVSRRCVDCATSARCSLRACCRFGTR